MSSFLSKVVSEAVEQLIEAGCVEVGEAEEEEENPEGGETSDSPVIPLYCTPLGRLASFYYVSHKTIHLYDEAILANTTIEDLIYILSVRSISRSYTILVIDSLIHSKTCYR